MQDTSVYKITLYVVDHNHITSGRKDVDSRVISLSNLLKECAYHIGEIQETDITWDDSLPINHYKATTADWERYFRQAGHGG